mmetsp:Transcript_19362/g.58251  ORF Transcript_19362/g.58251 Transcript_19362/m.58251 type:complete len:279 (+) Transcript_19362:2033-2869(+)
MPLQRTTAKISGGRHNWRRMAGCSRCCRYTSEMETCNVPQTGRPTSGLCSDALAKASSHCARAAALGAAKSMGSSRSCGRGKTLKVCSPGNCCSSTASAADPLRSSMRRCLDRSGVSSLVRRYQTNCCSRPPGVFLISTSRSASLGPFLHQPFTCVSRPRMVTPSSSRTGSMSAVIAPYIHGGLSLGMPEDASSNHCLGLQAEPTAARAAPPGPLRKHCTKRCLGPVGLPTSSLASLATTPAASPSLSEETDGDGRSDRDACCCCSPSCHWSLAAWRV